MSEAATSQRQPEIERTIQRGQIWTTQADARILVIGVTSKTHQIMVYVYGDNKYCKLPETELVALIQDVCLPYSDQDVPPIKAAGRFSWDTENGFRQLPKEFTSDSGATTLVRMEDALVAVNAALQIRDKSLASLQNLREAVAQFQQVLEAHESN